MSDPIAARPANDERPPKPAPFGSGELPPRKVSWLHPVQLLRTGYHALLSQQATEFLDRREMLAALRARPPRRADEEDGPDPVLIRQDQEIQPYSTLRASEYGKRGIWIDFVADIGDSWEATYSTLSMAASYHDSKAPDLQVRGCAEPLPRADVLVLGGDLVYPTPSRTAYRDRTESAFIAAMPSPPRQRQPCLLAIPGNHDWYDGLTSFVRQFCQGGMFGGWTLVQTRSYFAVKLAPGWWIWGIDIALDTRIDSPQLDYFLEILKGEGAKDDASFVPGDSIILCTAKPTWLDDPKHSAEARRNLSFFVTDFIHKHKGKVPVILSGDIHHYSRYECTAGSLITAGGGGAYLSSTHHLPRRVVQGSAEIGDEQAFTEGGFPYPSRARSKRLALGTLALVVRAANWPFALTIGLIGWLMTWRLRTDHLTQVIGGLDDSLRQVWLLILGDSTTHVRETFIAAVVMVGCIAFAMAVNNRSRWLRALWGTGHGLAQIVNAFAVAYLLRNCGPVHEWLQPLCRSGESLSWPSSLVLGALLVAGTGLTGATIVGIYLVVSDRLFGWHRNEVFLARSIIDYRNFLRMHIDATGTRLRIYPIGLERVPRRWRQRHPPVTRKPPEGAQGAPLYQPGDAVLEPFLIESAIEIGRDADVSPPDVFPSKLVTGAPQPRVPRPPSARAQR